jgi:hypothetical protein
VLEVTIHGKDEFTLTVVESGGQRRGLAEIPAQFHHHHAAIDGSDLLEEQERVILAAIVDENQLERFLRSFHDYLKPVV